MIKVVVWYTAAAGSAVLLSVILWADWRRALVEAACLLVVLLVLLTRTPAGAFYLRMRSRHRVMAGLLFLPLMFAQLLGRPHVTFPFVSFHLYSHPPESGVVVFHQIEGVDHSGRRVALIPGTLFPHADRSMIFGLERLGHALSEEGAADPKRLGVQDTAPVPRWKRGTRALRRAFQDEPVLTVPEARQIAEDVFQAFGRRYHRAHPEQPLLALEFRRCRWNYRKEPLEAAPCSLAWQGRITAAGDDPR